MAEKERTENSNPFAYVQAAADLTVTDRLTVSWII